MCAPSYAGYTDVGRERSSNDDRWAADTARCLYIVADGVATSSHGGLAAQLVIERLPTYIPSHLSGDDLSGPDAAALLGNAVVQLSDDLHAQARTDPQLAGAGTTIVAAVVTASCAVIAHLGDSRAYLYRDRQVQRLTRDHSLVQTLVDAGEITPAEAADHRSRAVLTRHVAMPPPAKPDVCTVDLQPADRLLLCTDGLHGVIDDASLSAILAAHPDPAGACEALIDAANQAGGPDNITALVIDSPAVAPSVPPTMRIVDPEQAP
jgi:PPM family protein phosphatase